MAVAVSNVVEQIRVQGPGPEGFRALSFDMALDTSYPTGGSVGIKAAIDASADVAVENIVGLLVTDNKGYLISYDKPNDKLVVRQQPAAAAAGPSPEVPNTTNLSAVTIRGLAFVE